MSQRWRSIPSCPNPQWPTMCLVPIPSCLMRFPRLLETSNAVDLIDGGHPSRKGVSPSRPCIAHEVQEHFTLRKLQERARAARGGVQWFREAPVLEGGHGTMLETCALLHVWSKNYIIQIKYMHSLYIL